VGQGVYYSVVSGARYSGGGNNEGRGILEEATTRGEVFWRRQQRGARGLGKGP
jgi:hypothetical protein